jgi:hypothetical protein
MRVRVRVRRGSRVRVNERRGVRVRRVFGVRVDESFVSREWDEF